MVRIKTLLNLLGSTTAILALAPVLPFLDPLIIGAAVAGVLWGAWCDRKERYPLSGLTATALALVGIAFYAIQITRADVATPVAHAMIVLLIIRLMTPKEPRDFLQIFVLALFILASSSLISLDLGLGFGFLSYLVLMIFSVTLGLVLLTVFVTDKRLALPRKDFNKLVKVSLVMPAVSLILMLVFFFVLPRTRHPLWNFLNPVGNAKVGLAESVQPGAYARISSIESLAFRAEMEELSPDNLYWRALVLNQPDGQKWIRKTPPKETAVITGSRRAIKLTVYPEARSDHYLVTLDRPAMVSGIRHRRNDDHVFKSKSNLDHPYKLDQLSHLEADLQVSGSVDRSFYLVKPEQVSARMRNVASEISHGTTSERLAQLAEFFRNQELNYARDDLPGGADPIDDFLFESKRGYCEFYATAYVTLARLADIPARMIGGYYGGEYNPFGGYYLVSEDKAHVWVEVLTEDNRWVRVDPSQWAINASGAFDSSQTASLGVWQRLMDNLNYRWVQTVLLFDFADQLEFLKDARRQFRSLRSLRPTQIDIRPVLWMAGFVVVIIAVTIMAKSKRLTAEARLLEQFRQRVRKRYGEVVSPASGLSELGERVDNDCCREFARIYQQAIFRNRALSGSERAQLQALLKKI